MSTHRARQLQRQAAATGAPRREHGAEGHDPAVESLDTYFTSDRCKAMLHGLIAPDTDPTKQLLQAVMSELTELKDAVTVLANEVRETRQRAAAEDEPMAAADGAPFTGRVRQIIYSHMCEDGFFPSINQLMAELLEENQRLSYAAVPEEDSPADGEAVVLWERRKKKPHRTLSKKVS